MQLWALHISSAADTCSETTLEQQLPLCCEPVMNLCWTLVCHCAV